MPVRVGLRLSAVLVGGDDRALLARFAADRDEHAFAAIVARHARMVHGVCRRALRDEHLAEDAFQAVFLVLAQDPTRASSAASLAGWLFGVARRVGLAARRHEDRRRRREATVNPTPSAKDAGFDDLLRVLDEELAALPEANRAAIIACFLEERTQDEAAKELGWSLSTLRRRLDRGKELLRVRLTRRGGTLAGTLCAAMLAPSAHAAIPPRLVAKTANPSALAQRLAMEVTPGAVELKLGLTAMALVALGGLGFAAAQPPQAEPAHIAVAVSTASRPASAPVPQPPQPVTLTGQIVFPEKRDIPPVKLVAPGAIKDRDFFGQPAVNDILIEPKTRGIANAVVWLRPDSDDAKATFPANKLPKAKAKDHVVQAGVAGFTPRVVAVREGDRIVFGNPAPIAFNVHYQRVGAANLPMGGETGQFNVLLPSDQKYTTVPLSAKRTPDFFSDAIHSWVRGYAWVFDHPYFAVTDAKGRFTIANAPPGQYRLMVWQEKVGYRDGAKGRLGERITVKGEGKLELGRVVMTSPHWDE